MHDALVFAIQPEAAAAGGSGLWDALPARYVRLEEAERRLAARVQRRRAQLAPSALERVERERRRLGRELHTGVGQLLAAAMLQAEAAAAGLAEPAAPVREALGRLHSLSREALSQVRAISHRLYPPEWRRLPLEQALRRMWENAGVAQLFESRLRIEPLDRQPEREIKVMLYRAAQEGLSNITRHAAASRVEMALETFGETIVLTLHDNGRGFAVSQSAGGLGMRSMRDAAADVGARVEIESSPGNTTLRIWAPFAARRRSLP
jgi:signal transduction histidine kinase